MLPDRRRCSFSVASGHPLSNTQLSSVSFMFFAVSCWNCAYIPGEMGKYDFGLIVLISASGTCWSFVTSTGLLYYRFPSRKNNNWSLCFPCLLGRVNLHVPIGTCCGTMIFLLLI